MNSLKQAIIASLVEHPSAEKYRQRAFVENPAQLAEALAQKQVLTKADFFAPDDEGKTFIDTAGAWKNFDKIVNLLRLGGESFTYDDFVRPMISGTERTLLESARMHNSTAKIFTFEIWKGRFEDMEKLWYSLTSRDRPNAPYGGRGLVPVELKRQLLAAEGKVMPEDRLAKAGLTVSEIRGAVMNDASFNDVNRRLKQAGDYFRKEYVMLPDSAGDAIFDTRVEAWKKFEATLKIMQVQGERLEASDYLRQLANSQNLLQRAAEKGFLNKVFTSEQWVDRLPDMLSLWSHVLDAWKRPPMTTQDFDNAYAEAEGMTYAKRFLALPLNGRDDLLVPLNQDPGEKPVLPLGLKVVWNNFDAVREQLGVKEESLTTADLRLPSGQLGDTCLISAAKFGCFDKAAEVARQCGQPITVEDFLSKDGHGATLISILAEKKQLSLAFTVDAWIGNITGMKKLWDQVPPAHKKQVDFQRLETAVRQETLKLKNNPKIRPQ